MIMAAIFLATTNKMDRPVGEFLDWIERVYKHQQNGELNNEHFSTIQSIT